MKSFILLAIISLCFMSLTCAQAPLPPAPAYNGEDIFDIFTVEDKVRLNMALDIVIKAGKVDWNNTVDVATFNATAAGTLNYVIAMLADQVKVIDLARNTSGYDSWLRDNQKRREDLSEVVQMIITASALAVDPTKSYKLKIKAGLEVYRHLVEAVSELMDYYVKQEEKYIPKYIFTNYNNTVILNMSLGLVRQGYPFQVMLQFVLMHVPHVTPQDLARLFVFIEGVYTETEIATAKTTIQTVLSATPVRYQAFLNAFNVRSPL